MTHAAILLCLLLAFANFVEGTCPPAPHSGRWAQRSPMPVENSEFGIAVLNGMIYTAGGFLEENQSFFGIYNPRTGTWQQGPNLPIGTHHPGMAATNGKVFVLGGAHAEDKVQIYDPVASTWSMGRAMPTPRVAMAAVVFSGKIHLIGGTVNIQQGAAMQTHEVYDPVTDTWQSRAPLPIAGEHIQAGALNGRIFVVGGRSMFNNLSNLQIYNPSTNTWTPGPDLQNRRSGFGLVVFEKRIYVFGGEDVRGQSVIRTVERFDPETNRWEFIEELPVPVHGNPSATFGRFIYVFGGAEFAASGEGSNFVQRLDISNAPTQPKDLVASAITSTSVRLKWKDTSNNEDVFLVQMKGPTGGFRTTERLPANRKDYTATGLSRGTQYLFRVVASNDCAASPPSNVVTVSTRP